MFIKQLKKCNQYSGKLAFNTGNVALPFGSSNEPAIFKRLVEGKIISDGAVDCCSMS